MPQFFSNKRLILLLVGMIFLVALISFSLRDRNHASLPEQVIKDVVGFGQSIFSKPTQYITGVFDNVESLLNTYDENKRLKVRLEDYVALQASVNDLRLENDELRKIVDKEEDLRAYNPIQATVIARNPDQWEEKIIIDKGEIHGIEVNMAVMTAQGLIGKVTLTTPYTSTVELLSTQNPNYRVSAVIAEGKEVFGLIEGYDEKRKELILKRIDSEYEVKKGQKVTTSGLGGIFPKGILIGEVTEVTTDDYGLTKLAYVKPAASFSILDHVIVSKRTITNVDGTDGGNTDADLTEGAGDGS
ncbi:rod shape-determining protein MreC [Psychrobacillus psychrotolerans]|uniref:Cell shape-determining protein MreC n=1 Tax=Psychrobacillus psychrotolerans TaxID=126156 RepID=A0A1I5YVD0_9BACI|nr:rod shape-determining protein MreC [Psychrobacillus psychrotolerans]SFQ48176.1 rod shape-determining protein MreC [Psychrobacillus psychrotolerans]